MKPQIQLNVYFDDAGYQADIIIDGKEEWSQCRDFRGTPPADLGRCAFVNLIIKAVEEFRQLGSALPEQKTYRVLHPKTN